MPQSVLQQLESDADAALYRFKDLLTIPSVSTDPAHKPDIERAAEWVAGQLKEIGLETRIIPTAGHPVVVGRSMDDMAPSPDAAPRVLFYGHYDVQPPDPIDKWTSAPFHPTLRNGAIYARGASDDKGQVLCFIEALRAWKWAHGRLPVNVTVLIEGEEEIGSEHLPAFLEANRELLAADIAVVSDTAMWDTPAGPRLAIVYALRGLLYFDIQLHGANRDLHSGLFGGTQANPATMIARVIGRLFDDDHRVTIPGYYDDVLDLTAEERDRWHGLHFDEKQYLGAIGMEHPFGEIGFDTLERRWARPACDVNGIYGGYAGPGAKTVIPSYAGAKVSFRLAANQDPAKVAESFKAWLHGQDVGGLRWQITEHGRAYPVIVPTDSPYMKAARDAIKAATGEDAALIREGATIPVVADFKRILGIDTLLIGFGRTNDRLHAPDEKFDLASFELGRKTHAILLERLGEVD